METRSKQDAPLTARLRKRRGVAPARLGAVPFPEASEWSDHSDESLDSPASPHPGPSRGSMKNYYYDPDFRPRAQEKRKKKTTDCVPTRKEKKTKTKNPTETPRDDIQIASEAAPSTRTPAASLRKQVLIRRLPTPTLGESTPVSATTVSAVDVSVVSPIEGDEIKEEHSDFGASGFYLSCQLSDSGSINGSRFQSPLAAVLFSSSDDREASRRGRKRKWTTSSYHSHVSESDSQQLAPCSSKIPDEHQGDCSSLFAEGKNKSSSDVWVRKMYLARPRQTGYSMGCTRELKLRFIYVPVGKEDVDDAETGDMEVGVDELEAVDV